MSFCARCGRRRQLADKERAFDVGFVPLPCGGDESVDHCGGRFGNDSLQRGYVASYDGEVDLFDCALLGGRGVVGFGIVVGDKANRNRVGLGGVILTTLSAFLGSLLLIHGRL